MARTKTRWIENRETVIQAEKEVLKNSLNNSNLEIRLGRLALLVRSIGSPNVVVDLVRVLVLLLGSRSREGGGSGYDSKMRVDLGCSEKEEKKGREQKRMETSATRRDEGRRAL